MLSLLLVTGFFRAHHVGLVDLDQAELAVVEQLADGRFCAEFTIDGRAP